MRWLGIVMIAFGGGAALLSLASSQLMGQPVLPFVIWAAIFLVGVWIVISHPKRMKHAGPSGKHPSLPVPEENTEHTGFEPRLGQLRRLAEDPNVDTETARRAVEEIAEQGVAAIPHLMLLAGNRRLWSLIHERLVTMGTAAIPQLETEAKQGAFYKRKLAERLLKDIRKGARSRGT